MDELDYRLDGFTPATVLDEADTEHLLLSADMHHLLASHHSQDGRNTYLLAYDQTAIWDAPGSPTYLAINVQRDPEAGTYSVDNNRQPLLPLAQNWLIRHGCPPAEMNVTEGPDPSSPETTKIEDRYAVLDHYTVEPVYPTRDGRTWALLYDHHPDAATVPFKAVAEHTTADLDHYSLAEEAFPTRYRAGLARPPRRPATHIPAGPRGTIPIRQRHCRRGREGTTAPSGRSPDQPRRAVPAGPKAFVSRARFIFSAHPTPRTTSAPHPRKCVTLPSWKCSTSSTVTSTGPSSPAADRWSAPATRTPYPPTCRTPPRPLTRTPLRKPHDGLAPDRLTSLSTPTRRRTTACRTPPTRRRGPSTTSPLAT